MGWSVTEPSASDTATRQGSHWPVVAPLIAFLVVGVLYIAWSWSNQLGDFGGDNATYLLTAQYFSPWAPHSPVAEHFARVSQYPPVYPLILGMFGAGPEAVLSAHLVTTAFLIGSLIVLWLWLRALGQSRTVAVVLPVMFALLPGTYKQALSILSENVYLFFGLASLACASLYERSGNPRWLWVAAATVSAAALTRGAGLALFGALLVYLAIRRPSKWFWMAGASFLPLALWQILRPANSGYIASLMEKYGSDPLKYLTRHLVVESTSLWSGWLANFSTGEVGTIVLTALGVLAIGGSIWRARQGALDGLYVLFYLAIVLLWPFPAEARRFVYVVVPLLLVQGLLLVEWLSMRVPLSRPSVLKLLVVMPIFILLLPDLALTAGRFVAPLPDAVEDFRRSTSWFDGTRTEAMRDLIYERTLVEAQREAGRMVPEGDCVYSIKPSLFGLYGQRVSYIPPREEWPDKTMDQYLAEKGCQHVLMLSFVSPSFRSSYYPLQRLRHHMTIIYAWQVPGTSSMPAAMLARMPGRPRGGS